MSVDTSTVEQECESRREYEREMWRAHCRGGQGQANIEVEAAHSRSYSEVRVGTGRDGVCWRRAATSGVEGRERGECIICLNCC